MKQKEKKMKDEERIRRRWKFQKEKDEHRQNDKSNKNYLNPQSPTCPKVAETHPTTFIGKLTLMEDVCAIESKRLMVGLRV